MLSHLTPRQQVAATAMSAFSGFIVGAGAYVLLEFAFLWGVIPMIQESHNPVLTFGLMLAAAAAMAAIIGWQMLTGFCVGVIVTLAAAALAADFD